MNITDSPGAMLVIPLSATAPAGDCELSSIFQLVMSIGVAPVFDSSNQSPPTGLFPLDQGAISEMTILPPVPGEPISFVLFTATKAL